MILSRRSLFKAAASISLLLIGALPAPNSWAHSEPMSWTEVSWNGLTHNLEVIHRFHIHTAETALADAGVIERPDLMSLKAQAQMALYCNQTFTLKDLSGAQIMLDIVGADVQGQNIYIYLEAPLKDRPNGLYIAATMLRGIVPGMTNYVNVDLGGKVKSLIFRDGDGEAMVETE